MALLSCRDLTLGYDGKEILRELNFEISGGEYVCIVGENGSGKSTLIKTVLGLQSPLSGKVIFGDGLKKTEIGYLPQQTLVQRDFPATVYEIVLSGFCGKCGLKPFYNSNQKSEALENIEKMGISHLKNRCYRELSGGQQQRVLLARALCATQKLLLLDEPVAGLDPKVTAEMYELIEKLHSDGITVVMISHDIASVAQYATHILHIGDTLFYGTRDEYLSDSRFSGYFGEGGNK